MSTPAPGPEPPAIDERLPSTTKKLPPLPKPWPSNAKRVPGELVPKPIAPVLINAMVVDPDVEVAKFDGDEVAIKRFPAIERNVQGEFVDEPSVSASCGAVDDAIVSAKRGEVVPIPTTAFVRFV